ncbi:G-protein coupled receptor 183 [Trichoplax sp. H2]|nr:G-protein coupled receptor 183 [Trichoplax sp. H2]|eukprot:RDD38419.1 G-protein coupled receptor 183 [Trichoplax sp. H2]
MATNLTSNGILNQTIVDYDLLSTYVYIVSIPVFFIGILANFFLLYLISSDSQFNRITYKLIRIAVISDLISLHVSFTVFAITAALKTIKYYMATVMCQVAIVITYCCYGVSITTLCMISVDRYFAIVRPFSSLYRKYKKRIAYLGQAIGCIISFSVSGPSVLFFGVYPDKTKICGVPNMNISVSIYFLLVTLFLFIIPLLIIIINYALIIRSLVRHVRPGQLAESSNDDRLKKRKFVRVLITITSIYILSTWPYFASITGMAITRRSIREIGKLGIEIYLMFVVSFFSTFAVNVISPFVYFNFDYNIKRKLLTTIGRIMHKE